MKIPFRQGIVSYQTDINGSMQFLQAGSGGVTLYVSPAPTIVNFAHGNSNYLITESYTVTNAWPSPFTPGVSYWLYWDIDLKTGIRTFGKTRYAPVISLHAPIHPATDQHWFDLNTNTMFVWIGVWKPVVRCFAARYNGSNNFYPLANGQYQGTQIDNRNIVASGALLFDATGKPLKNSEGHFFTTEDGFVTGISTSAAIKLEFAIIEAIAYESIPAYHAVVFSDFGKVRLADQHTANNYIVGIVDADAYTGKVTQIITSGVLTNNFWQWSTINALVYISPTGAIIDTPTLPNQSPIGVVVGEHSILLVVPNYINTGPAGQPGPQGTQGIPGATGPKGDTGNTGPQGPQGPQGIPGNTGPQGPQGDTGPQGLQGPQGPQGIPGNTGAQGSPGAIGPAGPQGPIGPTGAVGPAGAIGPAGAQGIPGPTGPMGPPGQTTLAGLTDVLIGTPQDGDILIFDGISNKWKPTVGGKVYHHDQTLPSASWTINHGKNSLNYVYTILNASGELTLPDNIVTLSTNAIRIDFLVAMSGKANIILF